MKNEIICKYKFRDKEKFKGKPYCTCHNELCEDISFACDKNCQIYEDYKELEQTKEKTKELTTALNLIEAHINIFCSICHYSNGEDCTAGDCILDDISKPIQKIIDETKEKQK